MTEVKEVFYMSPKIELKKNEVSHLLKEIFVNGATINRNTLS